MLKNSIFISFTLFFLTIFIKVNHAQNVSTQNLNSDWHFKPNRPIVPSRKEDLGQNIKPEGYKTQLPNTALNALLENKAVENPFFRDNETKLQWLEKEDWTFEKTFDVEPKTLKAAKLMLVLRGVDTYADVFLNGILLAKTNNAFRTWELDAKAALKEKNNALKIVFTAPLKIEKTLSDSAPVDYPDVYNTRRMFTRKPQFHYGWDWGPRFVTCGLASAELVAWEGLKIEDAFLKQTYLSKDSARLQAKITINATISAKTEVSVTINGKTFSKEKMLEKGLNEVEIEAEVLNPTLWWTHNLGTPFLYEAKINVKTIEKTQNTEGVLLDEKTVRIGFRTIELVLDKDEKGETFFFRLNGKPIFIKGANYIPQHFFQELVRQSDNNQTIENAINANMNMLRVWGGGIYETDDFYNLCDEKGLLVWQDFMYACAMYPADKKFLENAQIEAVEQVKRLRNHPSLALWCGNNEINEAWHNWGWQPRFNPDQKEIIWGGYKALFTQILPDAVKDFAPNTPYWESSPRFGRYNNKSYTEGDNHDWFVWHDEKPFEHFEERVPRFMSEYGFQSFPEWKTIENFTDSTERTLESKVMLLHQKHPKGNQLIKKYMEKNFRIPKNFKDFVYVSQLLQADGIGRAIEAQRRAKPYCMGTLYWQMNDVYPVASWSSIDNFGRWKALHFRAKEAYANVLISPRIAKDTLRIHVVSDKLDTLKGDFALEIKDLAGKLVFSDHKAIIVNPDSSAEFYNVPIKKALANGANPKDVFVLCTFTPEGKTPVRRISYLANIKDLNLIKTPIFKEIAAAEGGFFITLKASNLIKNVLLSSDTEGVFADNYFDILPNESTTIFYKTKATVDAVLRGLEIRSLVDTY